MINIISEQNNDDNDNRAYRIFPNLILVTHFLRANIVRVIMVDTIICNNEMLSSPP